MTSSAQRQLYILMQLLAGISLTKSNLALKFSADQRTIQRDLASVRNFLADYQPGTEITYDHIKKGYYLVKPPHLLAENAVLTLIKILLASRALNKEETQNTIQQLLALISVQEARQVKPLIQNELANYTPVQHQQVLLAPLWDFSQYILRQQVVKITYQRQHRELVNRTIQPRAIVFSEFYFYVIAYNSHYDQNLFYRLDRIQKYSPLPPNTDQKLPRFKEGELRKFLQYMYPGKLQTIKFKYYGILEAALDRFPIARVLTYDSKKGCALLEVKVYDQGALTWFLSQGELVQILAPANIVTQIQQRLKKTLAQYCDK
ncbi:helix-turn-helix transcriptional regulator [Liquorilactobacillus nagelii]|uniref:helix-turn-helix transcriptional regulator n=1 Tax=Liquorilactobacillus nagelii TaxID=82688 RepID=UPI0039E9E261